MIIRALKLVYWSDFTYKRFQTEDEFRIFTTDDDEIQDEEGVKSVAPPPIAYTDEATVACLVANCSL